uniref:Uncharacterized protein n=1 Tax=Tanacetum cinerariifolium TaxID=118510 RepID=A0A699K1R2_TANCI|nr:hypothetical protein [Tanacetum cinerariifolium]
MAEPVKGNVIARRVIDDLVDCSDETSVDEAQTSRNMVGQLTVLIGEMEAFDDQGEVFDTLMGLRDDMRVKEAKLVGINDLITQGEEEIEMKEA